MDPIREYLQSVMADVEVRFPNPFGFVIRPSGEGTSPDGRIPNMNVKFH